MDLPHDAECQGCAGADHCPGQLSPLPNNIAVKDIYNRLMDEILQDASLKVNDRLAIFSSVGRLKSHRRSFSRAIQGRVSSSPEQKPSLLTSPSAL